MKLKTIVIENFAKFAVGGKLFDDALRIATILDAKDLPGKEKKEQALAQLKLIGYAVGGFIVDTAIQLAVLWLRAKAGVK